eukprot:GEZU01015712.1.p1 GENE.GEZU01015712.1~~GEZU01015712.1.p1  ORF type:complete len:466 (-),score=133.14 GEZU01015712.1:1077-2414(-)
MKEWINKFGIGSLMRVTAGTNAFVHIADPEFVKYVTIKNAKNYQKPDFMYSIFEQLGPNILTSNGDDWLKHRKIANPVFTDNHMKLVATTTVEAMNRQLKQWDVEYGASATTLALEVNKAMSDITLEVIGQAGFGFDLKAISKDQVVDTRVHSMTFCDALVTNLKLFMVRRFTPKFTWRLPYFEKPNKEVDLYLDEIIAKRNSETPEQQEQHHDLLSLLLRSREGSLSLNEKELKGDMLIFLFAGHDTTSTALTFALYELARHPEIQEKLRNEIDSVIGKRDPTYDDLPNLVYTLAVIEEAMRLHPPVPAVIKQNIAEDEIGGYRIPAHTNVFIQIYVMHHNPKFWDEPEVFRPERFDPRDTKYYRGRPDPFVYLPFSVGQRNCIGSRFSLTEARILLSMLMQHFTVHVPSAFDDDPKRYFVAEQPGIVVKPRGGMHLRLVKRRE